MKQLGCRYQYAYQVIPVIWLTDWLPAICLFLVGKLILLAGYAWYWQRKFRQTIVRQQEEIDQLRLQALQHEQQLASLLQDVEPELEESPFNPLTDSALTDEFLIRVYRFVEDHLADSNLSVEPLATAMNMSRMNLHRKLKAQAGLSANELIRSVRLQRAATLLLTDIPISTVSYTVGIESSAYFSRIFREEFGNTPSDYVLLNRVKK